MPAEVQLVNDENWYDKWPLATKTPYLPRLSPKLYNYTFSYYYHKSFLEEKGNKVWRLSSDLE